MTNAVVELFSSPLRGSFISTLHIENLIKWIILVFVPSTGFFYFYTFEKYFAMWLVSSFRPLYGVLLFLLVLAKHNVKILTERFSSPLRGSFISTEVKRYDDRTENAVFVPSTGFFYFYIGYDPLYS